MPRTDNYQWTITSGSTFQHGTFLCGEPWVVDNGDLTLTAVSPNTVTVVDSSLTGTLAAGGGPTNVPVLNPDTGKQVAVNPIHQNANFNIGIPNAPVKVVWCTSGISGGVAGGDISTRSVRYDDFRAGAETNNATNTNTLIIVGRSPLRLRWLCRIDLG